MAVGTGQLVILVLHHRHIRRKVRGHLPEQRGGLLHRGGVFLHSHHDIPALCIQIHLLGIAAHHRGAPLLRGDIDHRPVKRRLVPFCLRFRRRAQRLNPDFAVNGGRIHNGRHRRFCGRGGRRRSRSGHGFRLVPIFRSGGFLSPKFFHKIFPKSHVPAAPSLFPKSRFLFAGWRNDSSIVHVFRKIVNDLLPKPKKGAA